MRNLLFGAISGLLLSLLRAPLGLDLLQIPAVEAHTALGVRALALAVIAGGILASARAAITPALLAGATVGFAVHGLLLAGLWMPGTRLELVLVALLGLVLLVWIARGLPEPAGAAEPPTAPGFGELVGLALAAAGMAAGVELLARHLRLLGGQLAADDAVFGSVWLALLAIGAAAFGWIARLARWRAYGAGVALALAAAALFVGLRSLRSVAGQAGLREYLRAFGLDLAQHGTLAGDALLAAAFFVAPAFLLGSALVAADGRKRAFALLLGAACGLCLVPELFETGLDTAALEKHTFAAQYLTIASLVGVSGAAFSLLCLPVRPSLPRWLALGLALACGLPALLTPIAPQVILAPWSRVPVYPYLAFDAPEGLLSVEGPLQPGIGPLANKQVTLDRRTLVPGIESTGSDLARIALALAELPDAARARKDLRALVVGQLTPLYSRQLTQAGFAHIDRSAAWWSAMERIEMELFSGEPLPAGERLEPREARSRIAAGSYDLVYVPQASGDAPALGGLDVPERTLLVVWLDTACELAASALGDRVMLCAPGLEEPSLALVRHGRTDARADAAQFLGSGPPAARPRPLAQLASSGESRRQGARARTFARLAAAARGTPDELLARGLEQVYAAQAASSPFDSPAQRFELPAEALATLREAALARPPGPFVRGLWEWIGLVLAEKRWIPQMYEHLEPLARAHAPWPRLEQLLARADAESLEFEGALARLEPQRAALDGDPSFWRDLGAVEEQLGRADDALASWRRSLALDPSDRALARRFAMALVRKGDPEGRTLVEQLLQRNPRDEELRIYLGPGPYPAPPKGFEPAPARHDP